VDDNFVKLAAMGITILFSSGDSGSGYNPGGFCSSTKPGIKGIAYTGEVLNKVPATSAWSCCRRTLSSSRPFTFIPDAVGVHGTCIEWKSVNGTVTHHGAVSGNNPPPPPKLYPSWPASSPWVTAVGATRFVDQKVGNAEMATDQFGSGGGFSDMFSQDDAKWQIDAVQEYLSNPPKDPKFPPQESFSAHGRATPDVSALGEGYQVIISGRVASIGGTSASSPAFAGMVSLLNDARMGKGMKQLGFLNPFLYQNTDAFTDVVLGTNSIGRGTGPSPFGFKCTKGWDPATGLGTPKFDKLLTAALNACAGKSKCLLNSDLDPEIAVFK